MAGQDDAPCHDLLRVKSRTSSAKGKIYVHTGESQEKQWHPSSVDFILSGRKGTAATRLFSRFFAYFCGNRRKQEYNMEPTTDKPAKTGIVRIQITIKRRELILLLAAAILIYAGHALYKHVFNNTDVEVTDALAGNIFPSQIIATATADNNIILPIDTPFIGNAQNPIAVRIKSRHKNSKVRIEIAETPFSRHSVSEFVLPEAWTEYTVYPDIVWNYDALRQNAQPTPVSIVIQTSLNGSLLQQSLRTMSMRSINECMLGYYHLQGRRRKEFINTRLLFAAYVNEDNPQIDGILREALSTRIVNRFLGYQRDSATVINQVYALWNVLQRRHFKYSSISNSSMSSNMVFAQRVRTFDDAMKSSQINCVDGSVLLASLMRAINIEPILVRLPNHMFVGFYTDRQHKNKTFLETTMIGDVNLDDYFPEENLDSTLQGLTQNQASRITFEKSMQYANRQYLRHREKLAAQSVGYMYLEITNEIRKKIQPIGK